MVKKLMLTGFVIALICVPTLLLSAQEVIGVPAGCTWDDGICHCSENGQCLQTASCQQNEGALCVIGSFSLCGCTYLGVEEPE